METSNDDMLPARDIRKVIPKPEVNVATRRVFDSTTKAKEKQP